MTKAQQVKKAINGHFDNLSCINGKGTAYGWVTVRLDYPRQAKCCCNDGMYCRLCKETMNEVQSRIYTLVNESGTEFYTYTSEDGYNTESACLNILMYECKRQPCISS